MPAICADNTCEALRGNERRTWRQLRALVAMSFLAGTSSLGSAQDGVYLPEPAPVENIDLGDTQFLAVSRPPQMHVDGAGISLKTVRDSRHLRFSGSCTPNSRVVITAHRLFPALTTVCRNGRYEATINAPGGEAEDISATQLTISGDLHIARLRMDQKLNDEVAIPSRLGDLSSSKQSGEQRRIIVPAGTYTNVNISIGLAENQDDQPLVIDGNGTTIFKGKSFIRIGRANVTLKGFRFEGGRSSAIEVSGANVRITQSQFSDCGDQAKPQSQCILILPGATASEIDFNRFENSYSMSVKLRAGAAGSVPQPTGAYIHHNIFQDIQRRSGNGQEPIQIAGPGGGESRDALDARVEHNLFVRANGDVEAISLKAPSVRVRWNSFYNSDAAPNFRGASGDEVSGNVLRETRGIRISGSSQLIAGNIIICPKGPGLVVTHGSSGYANAERVMIRDNLVVSAKTPLLFAAQEQPPENYARNNLVVGNTFVSAGRGPIIKDQSTSRNPGVDNTIRNNAERSNASNVCRPVVAKPFPPAPVE